MFVVGYFVIYSVRKLLDTPSCNGNGMNVDLCVKYTSRFCRRANFHFCYVLIVIKIVGAFILHQNSESRIVLCDILYEIVYLIQI
jgi:hypothetical protein